MQQFKSRGNSPSSDVTTQGIIHIHPKGFGFVTSHNQERFPQDVFIPKHMKKNAVDGDEVEIAVVKSRKSDKGPEGFVLSILKRAKEQLVGVVDQITQKKQLMLFIPSLGGARFAFVKKVDESYEVGDRLLLNVVGWGEENEPISCEVAERIGSIKDPSSDILAAIKDFGIREEFPKSILNEVKQLPSKVPEKDFENRLDLTKLETITIDPTTAKDFDDALSLSEDEKGFHLAVHIADVSHYVPEGSPLDSEAKLRSNSTYFPSRCVPMLPEVLSNHLCSLKEKEIRLTLSVIIDFDLEGNVKRSEIKKAFIYSQKRFTYEEAKEVLDGKKESPFLPTLKRMVKLCYLLKKKRSERGSIDLALPEVVIQVDKKGKPYGYKIVDYDITHQLVEEFMLKANEIVAESFTKKGLPSIFRIHEDPSKENMEDFYVLARSLGFRLVNHPSQEDLQQLFEEAKKTPHLYRLSVAFVRSMKLAIYSHENTGHYGLALENYCHFTSPIRRYSDLVVHRLLFDSDTSPDLKAIALSCSEKERISFKAEMSVVMMKKLRLLKSYFEKDPKEPFAGVITKIKPFGFFFEAEPLQFEGFIHISDLHDDFYDYNPKLQIFKGQNTGKSLKVGDALQAYLVHVDLIRLECKWGLSLTKSKKRSKKKEKSSKKRFSKQKKLFRSRKKS